MGRAARILLLLILLVAPLTAVERGEGRSYIYVMTYILENRGAEPYRLREGDRSIPLFWSSRYQSVELLNSTYEVLREYTDEDGNPIALLNLPEEIPPGSSINFTVAYLMELTKRPKPRISLEKAETPEEIPDGLRGEFCVPTGTFTVDEEMRRLASRITENESSVLGMVLALLGWIRENVYYGTHDVPRYPRETMEWGLGDCDDQAILLITLCRALEIPALLQLGCVYLEGYEESQISWGGHLTIEQRDVGWHGWALVYIPPWGWLPVDLTLKMGADPMSCLVEAPEYGDFIVVCYNITKSDYVGQSRMERRQITHSSLYITLEERMVRVKTPLYRRPQTLIITAMPIVAVITILLLWRLRERLLTP